MKKIAKKLIILSILLSGTQIVCLPIINLSIYQISLIISIFMSVIAIISEQIYIPKGKYLLFCLLYFISSLLAWRISINPEWAKSYCLLGLLTTSLIFVIPILFEQNDVLMLQRALIRSQYIVFPFSVYSFYMFYFRGGLPSNISLFGGMYIALDADTIRRAQVSSQLRLTLPYATPPILSIAVAMCIVLLLYNNKIFKGIKRYGLIFLFSVILVLTGSRSGIIGLIITLLLNPFIERKVKTGFKRRYVLLVITGVFCIVAMLPKLLSMVYVQKLIFRFKAIGEVPLWENRHILVPLDGLILWCSSLKNFILGIGFGSSVYINGAHTYLPPYFLNIYVTLIAERGIIGLFLVIMMIGMLIRLLRNINYKNDASRALAYCLLCGLIAGLFYEGLNCYFFIYVLAVGFLIDITKTGQKID